MVVENQDTTKAGGYVGGFFQLFGRNGKSRKKLFPNNKLALPEGSKLGNLNGGKLPMGRLLTIEDENGGGSSYAKESDSSCVSSTTDDEEKRIKAPSVVARLMGLDSLPSNDVSELYSTPISESRPLPSPHYQVKCPEFHKEHHDLSSNGLDNKDVGFSRKAVELRPQTLQKMSFLERSPVQRFQTEKLPLKPSKSNPRTHHKLLSPIRSPGFVSAKNAAQIMEAASRILEPGLQVSTRNKFPIHGSSTIPTTSQSRPFEAPKRPVESSTIRYLKGQSMNKSWNGLEVAPSLRVGAEESVPTSNLKVPVSSSKQELSFPDESKMIGYNGKGKSISLAIQAKVNVQRSLSSGSSQMPSQNSYNKSLMFQKEHGESKFGHPPKNQPNNLKNRQKKSVTGSPNVLRQNNQKQNCSTNKDKLPSKPTAPSQQGRKGMSGDASFGWEQRKQARSKDHAVSVRDSNNQMKNLTGSKDAMNSTYAFQEKANTGKPDLEKNISSSRTKNFIRKKRCLEGDLHSDYSRSLWNSDKIASSGSKSTDVVSFTFTSPMMPVPESHSSLPMLEKQNVKRNFHREQNVPKCKIKNLSTSGSKILGEDALSILLEQKLRELTSGIELASSNSPKAGSSGIAIATASVLQDLISALNTVKVPKEPEMKPLLPGPQSNSLGCRTKSVCSTKNDQMMLDMNRNLHGGDGLADCSSSTSGQKDCLVYNQPSPMSTLEASFSYESCNSSESLDSNHGYRLYPTLPTENAVCLTSLKKNPSLEADQELSDSAISALMETLDRENSAKISLVESPNKELEYVREFINSAELMFEDYAVGHASGIIDPKLVESLANQKTGLNIKGEDEDYWELDKKVLFDCVGECLDLKYSRYSGRGYKAWARGMTVVGRRAGLAEEVYKEILGWTGMGDWMVDDIVEKDMSSHLGRWTDFEIENFEIGVEIEREVLQFLVDEVIFDVFG